METTRELRGLWSDSKRQKSRDIRLLVGPLWLRMDILPFCPSSPDGEEGRAKGINFTRRRFLPLDLDGLDAPPTIPVTTRCKTVSIGALRPCGYDTLSPDLSKPRLAFHIRRIASAQTANPNNHLFNNPPASYEGSFSSVRGQRKG